MYMLRWYSALAHLDDGERVPEGMPDLRSGELAIAVPLILILLALTAYPFGVMERISMIALAAIHDPDLVLGDRARDRPARRRRACS